MCFLFSFSSNSTVVASISCICNCKLFCIHLCNYKLVLLSATEDSPSIVAKMVDWIEIANAWTEMDKIPYSGSLANSTLVTLFF